MRQEGDQERGDDRLLPLGVSLRETWLSTAWYTEDANAPGILDLSSRPDMLPPPNLVARLGTARSEADAWISPEVRWEALDIFH
jgi:hypothetical protein